MHEVRLRSKRVQKELDNLPESDLQRVLAKLKTLAHEPRPRGCEKLHDEIYRSRVGDFRIIYLINHQHKRIDVGAVRRRSEATYKQVENLFR